MAVNANGDEQKSFIELLGKVDLFLTHNHRDLDVWGQLCRVARRWRTCLDLELPTRFRMEPDKKATRPILFGSSYDERAHGLFGLIACKDLGYPLWHQNRNVWYDGRNEEMAEVMGVTIAKEVPYSSMDVWLRGISGAYVAVHPMPATAAGRDQIAFAALGIPCVGNRYLDIQQELFPGYSCDPSDVTTMRYMVSRLMDNPEEYKESRHYAMEMVLRHGIGAAEKQAAEIKKVLRWE